ncbi:MAG: hypothetical protein S4CHLAM7_06970 [Chlamydiae bacterium]|nr:hypothetical protein [Chlamydiota bacterium]
MNRNFFFAAILCTHLAFSGEVDLNKKANKLFEAGAYSKAIEAYQELLKEQKLGIKQDILNYNLGSAHLGNQEYVKAIDLFSTVMSNEEHLPKYLIQRIQYNLTLSYLGFADFNLDNLDVDQPLNSIKFAQQNLKDAVNTAQLYQELKYPELDKEAKIPDEIKDLKNSFKELHSKLKKIQLKVSLDSLTFSGGLQKLLEQINIRIFTLDAYLAEDLPKDFQKYLLMKEYLKEKTNLPYWSRLEELINNEYESAQADVQNKDHVAQQQDDRFAKQSTFRALYDQANYRHRLSLDYLKDRDLQKSRLEQAKAKLDLFLMNLAENEMDGLEHCLTEKIAIKNRLDSSLTSAYSDALSEEIQHYNSVAYGIALHQNERIQAYKNPSRDSKTFAQLDELKKVKDLNLVQQMIARLRGRLKEESNPSLDKLSEDYYLYLLAKVEPEEILYKLYERLDQAKILGEKEIKEVGYQFFALHNRLEIQNNFSYDDLKNKKIKYALEGIPKIQQLIGVGSQNEVACHVRKLLINWNFEHFISTQLSKLKSMYLPFLSEDLFEWSNYEELCQANNEILDLKKDLQDPESYQETLSYLENRFTHLDNLLKTAVSGAFEKEAQSVLMKSTSYALDRMIHNFKDKKLNSKEILSLGIKEEKLSLEFSQESNELETHKEEDRKAYFELAKESQEYPIAAVELFEETFKEEEKGSTQQEHTQTENEIVRLFKAGYESARKAELLLSEENVAWNKVSKKQEKAIEYWQKALEAYKGESEGDSSKDASNSSNGDTQDQESQSTGQSEEKAEAGASEVDTETMEANDESSMQEILEALQEMQQDDQVRPKNSQTPKQGLRPW